MATRPVTCSLLALACVGCLVLVLTVRGAEDWSDTLGVTFYGLVIGAFGLSAVGGLGALRSRTLGAPQRLFCIAVGIGVPALFAYSAWAILEFLSHVS
jgi:hypothetical protein